MTTTELSKRLLFGFALAGVVMTAFVRLGSYLIHYGVGAGLIGFTWAFLGGMPLVLITCVLGAAFALYLLAALGVKTPAKYQAVACLMVITFVVSPSWKTADGYLCQGLAWRITRDGSDRLLTQYLQDLLSEHPGNTLDGQINVIARVPPWLKQLFPERHAIVDFDNSKPSYLRVRVGGPYLRYGCFVTTTASDMQGHDHAPVNLMITSNIYAYAD